ncbi:uncharacterized protein (DUF2249 family) [Geodermatophilus sabuli]|nr:uncharacterized protein (DUF2249 family) [Geodermatophilus sabuli]
MLMQEVRHRERAVRAALGAGRWPDREIGALVSYLRYEVLDQAANEERLLFPLTSEGLAGKQVHGLVEDHVRLRDLTDHLVAADAPRDLGALVELLDDVEELLDRHMRTEQALLATTTTDGVEAHRRPFRCHLWFPLTEGPELDLDVLPPEYAHRAALERFSRLRPGECLRVRSGRELGTLWSALACGRPGEFGWAYLREGPDQWRAEVTRRVPG